MDALDEVLKDDAHTVFSRVTKLAIVEAVEKITENVERDFNEQAKGAGLTAQRKPAIRRTRKLPRPSSARRK